MAHWAHGTHTHTRTHTRTHSGIKKETRIDTMFNIICENYRLNIYMSVKLYRTGPLAPSPVPFPPCCCLVCRFSFTLNKYCTIVLSSPVSKQASRLARCGCCQRLSHPNELQLQLQFLQHLRLLLLLPPPTGSCTKKSSLTLLWLRRRLQHCLRLLLPWVNMQFQKNRRAGQNKKKIWEENWEPNWKWNCLKNCSTMNKIANILWQRWHDDDGVGVGEGASFMENACCKRLWRRFHFHVACKCTNNMHCILILKFATIKIFSTIVYWEYPVIGERQCQLNYNILRKKNHKTTIEFAEIW